LKEIESKGGEGLILRKPGSPYITGRSYDLLKVKSFDDDEATVIQHVKGKGRNADRMGTGRYESVLENLPYKYIYFRAYATNAGGTAYGNQKSIQMTCESGYTLKAKNPESGGKIYPGLESQIFRFWSYQFAYISIFPSDFIHFHQEFHE